MKTITRTGRVTRRIAYGVAGVGVASAIAVGGVATAAPAHPGPPTHPAPSASASVPGTKCSLAQVERALAHEDPALWQKIDSNPKLKMRFEMGMTMTQEQKQARRAEMKKNHPARAAIMQFLRDHGITRPEMQKNHQAIKQAKATCGQF